MLCFLQLLTITHVIIIIHTNWCSLRKPGSLCYEMMLTKKLVTLEKVMGHEKVNKNKVFLKKFIHFHK